MSDVIRAALQTRFERVVAWQQAFTACQALGPRNGGTGEESKARLVLDILHQADITDITRIDAPDTTVTGLTRPNIIARIKGKTPRTLWILSHMDVVPPGDLRLWSSDPWTVQRDGDILIGRGVEDNQQGMVSALLLATELQEQQIEPDISLGLIFVADEETGNACGMEYLMQHYATIFAPNDMFVVPDFGTPQGDMIEVAEKHVLWLKFMVHGKQCHGSMPHKGVNAMIAGSALSLALLQLHEFFPQADPLFSPAYSTFAPTRREANVPNTNTIPGLDVFCMDCRILPQIAVAQVLEKAADICKDIERTYGVRIEMHTESRIDAAPPTTSDSDVVRILTRAVADVYGVVARPAGVGGSTVACYLRRAGLQTAVWSRLLSNCHEPNEKSLISNNIGDAQVFAHMLFAAHHG